LQRVPLSKPELMRVIQGSIVPMVNPGPLLICKAFLDEEKIRKGEYKVDYVKKLILAFKDFLRFSFLGLSTSKYNLDENLSKLQEFLEKNYEDVKKIIESTIESAQIALEGNVGGNFSESNTM